ncbi:MAG: GatB/YqeY domain-containing protein [Herpetosiphonaceae bacterium]|nr:GatB/YqeY domain-containing protein [Herpetosiphonaceae bacterium]
MALDEQLQNDMKAAMRSKDTLRLDTIRLLRSNLQAERGAKRQRALDALVAQRRVALDAIPANELPPEEPLTEAEMQQVLAREAKKRQDSVEIYTRGGRQDLADQEQAELAILQSYLPARLSVDEVRPMVQAIITEVGATSKADMKKVMPVVMSRLRDKADGRMLNQLVGELLGP